MRTRFIPPRTATPGARPFPQPEASLPPSRPLEYHAPALSGVIRRRVTPFGIVGLVVIAGAAIVALVYLVAFLWLCARGVVQD